MNSRRKRKTAVLLLGLVCGVMVAFQPALDNGFVDFDDGEYITDNPMVRGGLSPRAAMWAFTTSYAGNWHPLTWLSHQFDAEIFDLDPRGHHLASLILHAAAAGLLFILLETMTGALWPSALTAAFFGLHPLRVESVAWASERKDVLAGLFLFLALLAYVRYVRRPAAARYLVMAVFFMAALLSKPTAVSLPLLLLLLDWWPLGRARLARAKQLVVEKGPLFLFSAASAAVTIVAQKAGGAVSSVTDVPWGPRLANALVSSVWYPWKTIWPSGLAVFYPYPLKPYSPWLVAVSAGLLASAFWAAAATRRGFPELTFGWLWYMVTILPVLGVIQAGSQARADRYTYVPLIGLSLAAVWGLGRLVRRRRRLMLAAAAVALLVLPILIILTRAQVRQWRDSRTLFRHAVLVTRDNWMAHINLGNDLAEAGLASQALPHLREAVRINPASAAGHYDLAMALEDTGRLAEAESEYRKAIAVEPGYAAAYTNWGSLLLRQGRFSEAAGLLRQAARLDPADPSPAYNLGLADEALGDLGGAEASLRRALSLKPDHAGARAALSRLGSRMNRPLPP